jgi:hypothetical protein
MVLPRPKGWKAYQSFGFIRKDKNYKQLALSLEARTGSGWRFCHHCASLSHFISAASAGLLSPILMPFVMENGHIIFPESG